jgi:quinohemoprotein ethanol dehydrogenase
MKFPATKVATACFLTAFMTVFYLLAQSPAKYGDVTQPRVLAETSRGANWLVPGGGFEEQHFTPLTQITDKNVASLGLAWSTDIDSPMGLATEPIVVDGIAYVSLPQSKVEAIDAVSGRVRWRFDPKVRLDRMRNSWAAHSNRGLAVWAGKVYIGTGDCRLVAIDAASGEKTWESGVCDGIQTGITGAPHVGNGKVFMGYNGSDTGVRGSVTAFDAATGKELWRFWTVPGDPSKGFESKALEMAAKTWAGDKWWEVGGGDVWDPITYDPSTNLVTFGTAGSNPSLLHGDRSTIKVSGDRLFSGSIVAVNADTGQYVWHYQTSTRTENMHILIADLMIHGAKRHVVLTVPKSGVFYVLDAKSGELLSSHNLDARVSETPAPGGGRGRAGTGHNWWPMSFSPLTGLAYVPTHTRRAADPAPGEFPEIGKLIAWDPVRQSERWSVAQPIATNSGVLSTAGNLVFQGEGTGEFAAYAADSGRKLWSIKTGSAIHSVPVSFAVRDEQYILVPVGWGSGSRLFATGSSMATPEAKRGPSRLLAFKLGAKGALPPITTKVPPVPKPPEQTFSRDAVEAGQSLYNKFFCDDCHAPRADGSGAWTEGGAIPDLRYAPAETHRLWHTVVLDGSHRKNGMPGFGTPAGFPLVEGRMSSEEADAIHAYVIDLSWNAYNEDQARRGATK